MLRHDKVMDTVDMSHMETSTDQVVRPVYSEAVDRWRGNIPHSILTSITEDLKLSAALRQFGYFLD